MRIKKDGPPRGLLPLTGRKDDFDMVGGRAKSASLGDQANAPKNDVSGRADECGIVCVANPRDGADGHNVGGDFLDAVFGAVGALVIGGRAFTRKLLRHKRIRFLAQTGR